MTENVRKVFDILGVEPNESFKLDSPIVEDNRFFFLDDFLNGYTYIDKNDKVNIAECNWLLRHCLKFPSRIIKTQKRKKHVGNLICKDLKCENCPLYSINCDIGDSYSNLYEILEFHYKQFKDKEIYDLFKKQLDKELE